VPDAHDIPGLERQIKTLQRSLKQLSNDDDLIELLRIIRSPGWTTPAEYRLVRAVATSMQAQVKALNALKQEMLAASQEIAKQR